MNSKWDAYQAQYDNNHKKGTKCEHFLMNSSFGKYFLCTNNFNCQLKVGQFRLTWQSKQCNMLEAACTSSTVQTMSCQSRVQSFRAQSIVKHHGWKANSLNLSWNSSVFWQALKEKTNVQFSTYPKCHRDVFSVPFTFLFSTNATGKTYLTSSRCSTHSMSFPQKQCMPTHHKHLPSTASSFSVILSNLLMQSSTVDFVPTCNLVSIWPLSLSSQYVWMIVNK